ncbi:MAG: hypothetical protein JWR68_2695 [Polaromonas sp.]|nr:hypothetical protein [Polaromonas sp.]
MENPGSKSGNNGAASMNAGSMAASGGPDSGTVQRGVDSAGSALHSTIDKMVDPALDTVDRVTTVAHETVDRLASGASQVAGRVTDQATRVVEASGRAVESSKTWIQEKPLEAVGLALALGFIWGRLTAH